MYMWECAQKRIRSYYKRVSLIMYKLLLLLLLLLFLLLSGADIGSH